MCAWESVWVYEVGFIPHVQVGSSHSSMLLFSINRIGKWGSLQSHVFGALLHINMKLVALVGEIVEWADSRWNTLEVRRSFLLKQYFMNTSVSSVVYMALVRLLSLVLLFRKNEKSSRIERALRYRSCSAVHYNTTKYPTKRTGHRSHCWCRSWINTKALSNVDRLLTNDQSMRIVR